MSDAVAVAIDIRDVPAGLVAAVDRDASERNTSVSDRITTILCSRYGLAYEPNGYPYTAGGTSDHWNLRIPERLRDALRGHAKAVGGTMTGCALLAISAHYGLPAESPRKRVEPLLPGGELSEVKQRHRAGESLRSLSLEYGVTRKALTRAIRET